MIYIEEYRDFFLFFDEEKKTALKVTNFQPLFRNSYQEYLTDGRKYIREIIKEYPKFRGMLEEELTQEYYATEYAEQMWQQDLEKYGEEFRQLLGECNREFLAMPKMERKKKKKRLEELFVRYEKNWKFLFYDFETLKEDYLYILSYIEK